MNRFWPGLVGTVLVGGLAALVGMVRCLSLVRSLHFLFIGTVDAGETPGTSEDDIACVPPPPPPPSALALPDRTVLGSDAAPDTDDSRRFWLFLQQETYRQRGGGFRQDWAFHMIATSKNLGAPLALSVSGADQVESGERRYGFQPFARDTLFNEIPKWTQVESLNEQLTDGIPATGLLRQLLEASFRVSGGMLRPDQAFAQLVIRERLGPALTEGFRITVDGGEYAVQVFALDTLYSPVGQWSTVLRLSTTRPGNLREALLRESYQRMTGSAYDPASPFHQTGLNEGLGTPLTGVYRTDFEGNEFDVQVFALDTLFARPGSSPTRQSTLPRPAFNLTDTVTPVVSTRGNALSNNQVTFHMLPLAGQPRISQFYGYTRFAAGEGRGFYMATQGSHSGIDFAVEVGTPLLAIEHGLVVWSGANVDRISFGAGPRSIIVRYGNVYALYGHVSREMVRKGQTVEPGQTIGLSGYPEAPHLHFELRPVPESQLANTDLDQNPVNPGSALNPIELFSANLMSYFDQQLAQLGGDAHFCSGSFRNQARIKFGGQVDNRPCE